MKTFSLALTIIVSQPLMTLLALSIRLSEQNIEVILSSIEELYWKFPRHGKKLLFDTVIIDEGESY